MNEHKLLELGLALLFYYYYFM